MEIICEDLFVDTENNQPLNKLRARKGGCKRLCSELSVPYIELAMNSLVLQDTILNIPAWARLDHNDTCDTITGPEKRSANDSLQSGLPHKKSKCSEMHTSATQVCSKTKGCFKYIIHVSTEMSSITDSFRCCTVEFAFHVVLLFRA